MNVEGNPTGQTGQMHMGPVVADRTGEPGSGAQTAGVQPMGVQSPGASTETKTKESVATGPALATRVPPPPRSGGSALGTGTHLIVLLLTAFLVHPSFLLSPKDAHLRGGFTIGSVLL